MKNKIDLGHEAFLFKCAFVFLFLLSFQSALFAQQEIALPANGVYEQSIAPQGALRYQRQLYLIKPNEMAASGIQSGATLNSIGFTIAAAQDTSTIGALKIYLENTLDTESRTDTSWTMASSNTNAYTIDPLMATGEYEWQVRANCSSNSPWSVVSAFSNDALEDCQQPINLSVGAITDSSVNLQWYTPLTADFVHYTVEYTRFDMINWMSVTTTTDSIVLTGLTPNKTYQWRVRSNCTSDSSAQSGTIFTTTNAVNCSGADSLMVDNITETTATLDWVDVVDATRYDIRYRRIGSTSWTSAISFVGMVNLTYGLVAGTTYEWQLRTVCAAGSGAYIQGPNFTTDGTTVCYSPSSLSADNISDTTATMHWMAVDGATSYSIRYRIKDAISWTNAIAPMTQVHHDSVRIPSSIGAFEIPFSMGSPFTYDGGGVYVAFEYQNDTAALSVFNYVLATTANTVIKDRFGADSLTFILCLNTKTDAFSFGHSSTLTSTNKRPQTSFGSDSFVDSVSIDAVYALGHHALGYADTAEVSALITNHAADSATYEVHLNVVSSNGGTLRYSTTQDLTMAGDTTLLISFDDYIPEIEGTDTLFIEIAPLPGENVLKNNRKYYLQQVGTNIIAYDDNSAQVTKAGFGVDSGFILVRHHVNGCSRINAAQIYLDPSAEGHPVYAVVLDENGSILDSSNVFTPGEADGGSYHTFFFPNIPSVQNADFYIGLAQSSSNNAHYPVGVQWEASTIRSNAYYRDSIGGSNLIEMPYPGRLMIRAQVIAGGQIPVIDGDLIICNGEMTELTTHSATRRFANEVLAFSSQFSNVSYSTTQILGPPDVYPNYGVSTNAWSSETADGQREYIELKFSDAAPVNYIDIYETLRPGAVDSIYVKNPGTDQYELVYAGAATAQSEEARINRITFPLTGYSVSDVRIALGSDIVAGYNSIDAVAIGEIDTTQLFDSYLWSPSNETTRSITVDQAGTYTVTGTTMEGCSQSVSATVIVPQQTIPVISIGSGDTTTFCIGDSVELISDQPTGNIWSTGATTQSIIVHTSGKYAVSYDDGTDCGLATSDSVEVNVNSLPTVSITGTLAICPDGSTMLDAGNGYASYLWSNADTSQKTEVSTAEVFTVTVEDQNGCAASASATTYIATPPSPSISGALQYCPGGSTTLDAGGGYDDYLWSTSATTQTINVGTPGMYSVTVTDMIGCTGETSVTTSLFTPPNPAIAGILDFCQGESTSLDAGSGYSAYEWSTTATSQSILASTAGTFSVTVTDMNGCTGDDEVTTIMHIPPTPVITGSYAFCGGSTTTLNAGDGYDSYLWSTGAISTQITVSDTGTYYVTVTDGFGCQGTASATTTVDGSIPVSPGPITGPTSGLCNATNVFYSIDPVPNATFYVWTVPDSVTILSGQGTTTLQVNFEPGFSGGTIVVAASNACGQSPSIDPTFLILNGEFDPPGPVSGPNSGTCNQSINTYSITPISGATSYTWTVPSGSVIQSGQGSPSIDVLMGGTSGDICVTVANSCGTSDPTCLNVNVNDFSVNAGDCRQVAPNFPALTCTDLTATVSGGVAPFTYVWEEVGGGIIGNTQSVNVCPQTTTTYQVSATDATGCIAISDVLVVVTYATYCSRNKIQICHEVGNNTMCLNTAQALSHINHGDRLGSCSTPDPCGGPLSREDKQTNEELEFHAHHTEFSAEEDVDGHVLVFPNPASDEVVIQSVHPESGEIQLQLTDALHRVIKNLTLQGNGQQTFNLDVSELSAGIYFVTTQQDGQIITQPLVIQR